MRYSITHPHTSFSCPCISHKPFPCLRVGLSYQLSFLCLSLASVWAPGSPLDLHAWTNPLPEDTTSSRDQRFLFVLVFFFALPCPGAGDGVADFCECLGLVWEAGGTVDHFGGGDCIRHGECAFQELHGQHSEQGKLSHTLSTPEAQKIGARGWEPPPPPIVKNLSSTLHIGGFVA